MYTASFRSISRREEAKLKRVYIYDCVALRGRARGGNLVQNTTNHVTTLQKFGKFLQSTTKKGGEQREKEVNMWFP